MSAPEAPVKPGDTFAGKYLIERVLGAGGMGVVVAARHVALDQKVAIKFLRAEAAADPDVAKRFEREGRAAAKIEGEHVVRVMDVGTADGVAYLVMEYLEGTDLAALVRERAPLPIAEAVGYVRQAADAVAEAHEVGIVHRDLKPANLFLARRRNARHVIKVLDFGISKHVTPGGDADPALTSTNAVFGSPLYMSPEQVKASRDVDGRTDVWALGVILHELLVGRPPFGGDNMAALVHEIVAVSPPPLHTLRSDVPEELSAIVLRCLAKERDERWPTVTALHAALERFDRPATEPPPVSALASTVADPAQHQTGDKAFAHTRRGPATRDATRTRIPIALTAFVAAGVVIYVLTRSAPTTLEKAPATSASTAPPPSAPIIVAEPTPTPAPTPSASATQAAVTTLPPPRVIPRASASSSSSAPVPSSPLATPSAEPSMRPFPIK